MSFYQDPCCGLSLYRGTKVVAIIDLATAVFFTVLSGFGLLAVLVGGDAILDDINDSYEIHANGTVVSQDGKSVHIGGCLTVGWLIITLLALTLLNVGYLFLARYLLHAAQERNPGKLQRWFDITTVVLAIRILGYIPTLFVEGGAVIIFGILWCTYSAYGLWVVHAFRKQLLTQGESSYLRDAVYFSRAQKI